MTKRKQHWFLKPSVPRGWIRWTVLLLRLNIQTTTVDSPQSGVQTTLFLRGKRIDTGGRDTAAPVNHPAEQAFQLFSSCSASVASLTVWKKGLNTGQASQWRGGYGEERQVTNSGSDSSSKSERRNPLNSPKRSISTITLNSHHDHFHRETWHQETDGWERGKACCVTHDILLNQMVYEASPCLDHHSLSPSLHSRMWCRTCAAV